MYVENANRAANDGCITMKNLESNPKNLEGDVFRIIVPLNDQYSFDFEALSGLRKLLEDTLNKKSEAVAEMLERVHEENVSILNYNDENALSFVVSRAYYSARKDYFMIRELPTEKGFADIVFISNRRDV